MGMHMPVVRTILGMDDRVNQEKCLTMECREISIWWFHDWKNQSKVTRDIHCMSISWPNSMISGLAEPILIWNDSGSNSATPLRNMCFFDKHMIRLVFLVKFVLLRFGWFHVWCFPLPSTPRGQGVPSPVQRRHGCASAAKTQVVAKDHGLAFWGLTLLWYPWDPSGKSYWNSYENSYDKSYGNSYGNPWYRYGYLHREFLWHLWIFM